MAAPAAKPAPAPAASSAPSAPSNTMAPAKKASSKPAATPAASDSDIAAAKSSGKVWVNLDSKVYHKSGRWYGKTKSGKFMTEDEAKAAGYKASETD
jgi:hypothetical protein